MVSRNNDTLADALPREQARVRELLSQYEEVDRMPNANCSFAIAGIKASLSRADVAASSGDVVAMIRALENLRSHQ